MNEANWIPEPSDETRPFFDGAAQGRLRLQVCKNCGRWSYPLMTVCGECGSREIEWRDACGRGTVFSHARLMRAYHPRHQDRLPLVLAQVDIEQGLRLMTNIIDIDPAQVRVGQAVEVAFETFEDGGILPVFKIAG